MAKVKIQGHASGTGVLTVTAPNTSSDRTITLPDATCTLADNSDVTNKLPLAGGTMTGALINTHTDGITVDSTIHGYVTINGAAANRASWLKYEQGGTGRWLAGIEGSETSWQLYEQNVGSTVLKVTQDGRGLSQFTAKAWCRYDEAVISDSHNVSSTTDVSSGVFGVNLTNALANANYAVCLTKEEGANTAVFAGWVDKDTRTTSYFKTHWSYAYSVAQGNADDYHNNAIVFGD